MFNYHHKNFYDYYDYYDDYDDGKETKEVDDIKAFMAAYLKNILAVTRKTQLDTKEITPEDPTASINCWGVTDNIMAILSPKDGTKIEATPKSVTKELEKNNLILFNQDRIGADRNSGEIYPLGQDHWFIVVGDNGQAHIIEHLENTCGGVLQSGTIADIVKNVFDIQMGLTPDRFYHEKGPHVYKNIVSFQRKPLSVKSVQKYITPDDEYDDGY